MKGMTLADRQAKYHRNEHKSGTVASGHQERPHGEGREADLHPAGAGLVSGRQAIQAKRDQDCRRCPTQRVQINNSAEGHDEGRDRKSTRLNSSHGYISYAVFCLKKKKNKTESM